MIDVLADHHVGQQAFGRQGFLHRLRRRGRLDHAGVAVLTRICEARRFDHVQTGDTGIP